MNKTKKAFGKQWNGTLFGVTYADGQSRCFYK
jgi:hypothetical protein